MLDTFLVPENTVVTAKGDSPAVDVSTAANPAFLMTLSISRVIEQESIEVSVFTSGRRYCLGDKTGRNLATEVLCRRIPVAGGFVAESRHPVCAGPLGSEPVGAGIHNSRVRNWPASAGNPGRFAAGSARRSPESAITVLFCRDAVDACTRHLRRLLIEFQTMNDQPIGHRASRTQHPWQPARAGRQVDLASLRHARGTGAGPFEVRQFLRPGPTVPAHWPACRASAPKWNATSREA